MNRLGSAASPYLRQHADNPVDWFEWGDEAFRRARERDVPVFLSVGYSSCHWCHVMAHESFEDDEVAALLNASFVSVKVDREERPDVDAVYMNAVQALTGRGGWPMSVFLTPEREPFFAGTYWPRDDRGGMPGFVRVLQSVTAVWHEQREQVTGAGQRLTARLREVSSTPRTSGAADEQAAAGAARAAIAQWDRHEGGFGEAPKFPQAMTIDFLLAHATRTGDEEARHAATHSLTAMARGGIYDHVGGGFARYATDRRWLVPHFEKMLYDNALLLRTYTHAAQLTDDPRYRRVVRETARWLLTEMADDEGGFASALDADSEGQEGKFYVWRPDEFAAAVERAGADPELWMARFGVTARGNVHDPHGHIPQGTSIIHEAEELPDDLETIQERALVRNELAAVRTRRVRPGLDDKVLVSWNGLAVGALAEAGAALGEPAWIAAARRTAEFLAAALVGRDADGRTVLWHRWTPGHGAGIPAFAEDVAYLAQGLLALYEADHDPRWLTWARELAADADARFRDPADGTYFTTPDDGERLIARPRELLDNATPATSSVMTDVHLRLAALTGDPVHTERAEQTLATLGGALAQMPLGFGELLRALERYLGAQTEVAIVGPEGPERDALVGVYRRQWRPSAVLAVGTPASGTPDSGAVAGGSVADGGISNGGAGDGAGGDGAGTADGGDGGTAVPLLAGRPLRDGRPTAYVCRNFACEQPVTEPEALSAQLARMTIGGRTA